MDKQVVIYIFISIHKVEYYLAVKGNILLIKSIHWMNLENIKLSRSQTQRRRKYDSIYVSFKTWQSKSMVIEIRIVVASVWEGQETGRGMRKLLALKE